MTGGRGDLCVDVNGRVGGQGTIGVGYWKRTLKGKEVCAPS
ncbi:hypothetical protein OG349_18015 [Streptomyces sp. NBC_01317]|nr:hypothetical protein OG349_18015 [Streptomyces sp. NBC_01317]